MGRVILQSFPQTPISESLTRLKKLVSPYTGIVRGTYELLFSVDDARAFYIATHATTSDDILGVACNQENGGGHYLQEAALAAAIGETVERYSGVYLPKERLLLSTARELATLAVEPERFSLFSDGQYSDNSFPFEPFTSETKVHWVEGFSLPNGEPAYLPAQLIYLGHHVAEVPGESRIGYTTSSGLACGPTLEEAILSALLEIIERDAFMITWLNKLSLPVLDLDSDTNLAAEIKQQLMPAGLQHSAIDMSVFSGVPTALGIVRNSHSDLAPFAVGAASAANMGSAVSKALLEAYQTRSWSRMKQFAETERSFSPDFSDIRNFDDHILFYTKVEHMNYADFLDASSARVRLQDVAALEGDTPVDHIVAIAKRLRAQGLTVYAVDITSPDIKQAGLYVVRVICPELCQLNASYRLRFLGGKRLYHLAYQLDLRASPLSEENVNPYPHPFP